MKPCMKCHGFWMLSLLFAIAMTACGGGGSGSDVVTGSPTTPTPVAPTPIPPQALADNTFGVDCNGSDCGASNLQYSGSGVGFWRYTNTSASHTGVPVNLMDVAGRTVTLVYTNQKATPVAMPPITLSLLQRSPRRAQQARDDAAQPVNQVPDQIREFNRNPPINRAAPSIQRSVSKADKPAAAIVGNTQLWNVHVDQMETRSATLRRKLTASDGRTINFWVENGEYASDRLTEAQLNTIASAFSSGSDAIYGMVTGLAGAPWGTHDFNDLIGPNQELDVVLVNFDHDNQPYGLMGYFWSYNNFKRSASTPQSNESLSLYLDTETVYRTTGETGLKTQLNTLAHELTHMINFYQRGVVIDNTFDTFLEETTALMMEDVVGLRVDPDYHPIRDGRFPDWLNQAGYNCNLTSWDDDPGSDCFSYSVNGSFGGYLLRYYGVEFYKQLLRNDSSSNSITLLDTVIRNVGGLGLADAVRRWGTSIALLPTPGTPSTFGYPERIDSGYTLPGIHGPDYLADRVLPSSVPTLLQGYAHFPVVRTPTGNTYSETISVPPGTTLTVIVQ